MLQITCPWCGTRDETEFSYGGQSHIIRPPQPEQITDAQWVDYLHNRDNSKGLYRERWQHSHACRQWFNIVRDTVSHTIYDHYSMTEQQPALPECLESSTILESSANKGGQS